MSHVPHCKGTCSFVVFFIFPGNLAPVCLFFNRVLNHFNSNHFFKTSTLQGLHQSRLINNCMKTCYDFLPSPAFGWQYNVQRVSVKQRSTLRMLKTYTDNGRMREDVKISKFPSELEYWNTLTASCLFPGFAQLFDVCLWGECLHETRVCLWVCEYVCVAVHGAGKLACSSCSQTVPVTVKPVR